MLNINDLKREIKKIIKKRYAEARPDLINDDIAALISEFQIAPEEVQAEKRSLEQEILDEYLKQNVSASAGDFPNISPEIPDINSQYAIVQGQVSKKIQKLTASKLKADAGMLEISNALNHVLGMAKSHAQTIARTSKIGQIRTMYLLSHLQQGEIYFAWKGPIDNRKRHYCSAHIDKIYRIDEILKMNNGQGLNVAVYMGGWNCRDRWQVASEEEYLAQNAQL